MSAEVMPAVPGIYERKNLFENLEQPLRTLFAERRYGDTTEMTDGTVYLDIDNGGGTIHIEFAIQGMTLASIIETIKKEINTKVGLVDFQTKIREFVISNARSTDPEDTGCDRTLISNRF